MHQGLLSSEKTNAITPQNPMGRREDWAGKEGDRNRCRVFYLSSILFLFVDFERQTELVQTKASLCNVSPAPFLPGGLLTIRCRQNFLVGQKGWSAQAMGLHHSHAGKRGSWRAEDQVPNHSGVEVCSCPRLQFSPLRKQGIQTMSSIVAGKSRGTACPAQVPVPAGRS